MKKKSIVFLLLCICYTGIGQSYIFTTVVENTLRNGEWGREVTSTQDIQVINKGSGIYNIKIYDYGQSQPTTTMSMKFQGMDGHSYMYMPSPDSKHSVDFKVLTMKKLSEMSKGESGPIYIAFYSRGRMLYAIEYQCEK